MDGGGAGGGILDAERVMGEIAFDVPDPFALAAAVLEGGFHVAVAPTVERDRAAGIAGAILCLDVNDPGGLEAELRRQRPIDQLEAADKTAVQLKAESGDPLRQQDAIEAELQVVVL